MDDGSLIWQAGKRAREDFQNRPTGDGGAAVWQQGKTAREAFMTPSTPVATPAKPSGTPAAPGMAVRPMAMPGDIRARAPAVADVASPQPVAPGPGTMKPASTFLGGVKRVYDEAGGGASGLGAAARDVGGSAVLGGGTVLAAPLIGVRAAGQAIGSQVADAALGFTGESSPMGGLPKNLPDGMPLIRPAAAATWSGRNSTVPPAAADSDPRAAAAPQTAAPAAPETVPARGGFGVIPTAYGGGYSGTPGFTASGGNVSTSAELSAARQAAAARGDTDALAASYQAGGGTFLGRTAAQDKVEALNKAALMSPRGGRAEKSFLQQAGLVAEQEGRRDAVELARSKQASDQTLQAAQTGQIEETTAGLAGQKATRAQQMKMLKDIADLDPATDPDGSRRQQMIDTYMATVHGKDIDPKYSVIEAPTGNVNPITGQEQMQKVALAHKTGKIITGERAKGAVPPGMKMVGTSGGRPVYEDGKGKRYIGD